MATSDAPTVDAYLDEMPPDRAQQFGTVLDVVRTSLPDGYEEVMNWGMACWQVPLSVYPDTYNGQPLPVVCFANQKRYLSLYLNSMYAMPALREILDASGRKLRMGKSCINFTKAEQLPLDEIGQILRRSDVQGYVAAVKAARKES